MTDPIMRQFLLDIASGLPWEQIMRRNEVREGHKIVMPGDVAWLPKSDWPSHIVISMDGEEVRIVAIIATVRGAGAFKRLVRGIVEAGLKPVVIEPLFDMPSILRKWGWAGKKVETRTGPEYQWRPSAISNGAP